VTFIFIFLTIIKEVNLNIKFIVIISTLIILNIKCYAYNKVILTYILAYILNG
jgi:hypothetical protein